MITNEHVKTVETVIGYIFRQRWLIRQALTAAGAEEHNYDGNRQLSQIGASLMDAMLAILVYNTGVNRGRIAKLRQMFLNKEHYSTTAKRTGIDQCIKWNQRTALDSPGVHRKGINAIIAAVMLDTFSFKTTLMATIRIFTTGNESLRLLASDPGLRESLLGVLEGITARDAGTIDPAILSGRTTDYQMGYPLVFNICDPSLSVPPMNNSEPQQDPSMATESEFLVDFDDPDLILQTPFPFLSLDPGPVSSLMEGISTDAWASPIQNALRSLPSVGGATKGNKRSYLDTTKQKKRKASLRDGKQASTMIDEFLSQERAKCKDERLLPEHTYFDTKIQTATSKFEESLAVLLVTIAAPQRIASLRDIICRARVEKPLRKYALRGEIIPTERVRMILELDEKVASAQLVRWYHIVALFEACGGPETRSMTRFVNDMPTTFQPQRRGDFGNPANKDDAHVAQTMMEEIYSHLQLGTVEYRTKLATFKKLRQLGKRLHLLVERFGRGVLGLMLPFGCDNGTGRLLPDSNTFDEFVRLLDHSQGSILRQFSVVVFPPLWALLQGRLEEEEPFPLERVGRDQILALTKGSPDLLRLIS
ncbi:hypothetical protein BJX61DRAFT_541308 [Aspergillus egyptiacus]|nr:hypothetical protein BJX61DRAFT_541308 [Aspergillus egyptiacus]